MEISKEEILHIAKLADLEITFRIIELKIFISTIDK